mgnify:CR=1 FL=1
MSSSGIRAILQLLTSANTKATKIAFSQYEDNDHAFVQELCPRDHFDRTSVFCLLLLSNQDLYNKVIFTSQSFIHDEKQLY